MDEREQQAAIDRAAEHLRRSARVYECEFCPGLASDFRFAADKLDPPPPPTPPEFEAGQWVRHEDGRCGRVDNVSTCHPRSYAVAWCNEACWCNWTLERELTRWFAPGTLVIADRRLGVLNRRGVVIAADEHAHVEDQYADWKELDLTELCGWVSSYDCSAAMLVQAWAKRLYGQPAAAGEGK